MKVEPNSKIVRNRLLDNTYDNCERFYCSESDKRGISTKVAKLLKVQKGKCKHCGLTFREGDLWEVDHIIPRSIGGESGYSNLQLLHRHCHDTKTLEFRLKKRER